MKKQKGITLIALVITIIVMLILVAVSVTVALRGGLFSAAKQAATGTELRKEEELALSGGQVTIGNTTYSSIASYLGTETTGKVTISPQKENYDIGEEVTLGGEKFFVIADDEEKIALLAKYNLNTAGTAQLNASYSETKCKFSSTNYWSTETEYPVNLNEYPIPEGVTSVITKAKAYGEAKGGTGRLLTYEEANELKTNYSGIIFGTSINAKDGYLDYWLGTANLHFVVWNVAGNIEEGHTMFEYEGTIYYGASYNYERPGVRPVVEFSK